MIGNKKRVTVELDSLASEEGQARRCWSDEHTPYVLSGQKMLVRGTYSLYGQQPEDAADEHAPYILGGQKMLVG